jgi:hypothetical protein
MRDLVVGVLMGLVVAGATLGLGRALQPLFPAPCASPHPTPAP